MKAIFFTFGVVNNTFRIVPKNNHSSKIKVVERFNTSFFCSQKSYILYLDYLEIPHFLVIATKKHSAES